VHGIIHEQIIAVTVLIKDHAEVAHLGAEGQVKCAFAALVQIIDWLGPAQIGVVRISPIDSCVGGIVIFVESTHCFRFITFNIEIDFLSIPGDSEFTLLFSLVETFQLCRFSQVTVEQII